MCDNSVLTQERLVERAHKGFAKKVQQEISIEEVRQTLKEIRLSDPPAKPTCRLQVERLMFCGQKSLANEPVAVPFNYDQKFSPGVNVVLVEDNDVGKSTILKTIKFALTGDDSDYDADVKKWIANVRLHFSMGADQYTIAISRTATDTGTFGLLLPGNDERPMGDLIKDDGVVFTAADQSEFQESLRRFFFDKIGLSRLGWALPPANSQEQPREAGTTWLTYFQALQIPDGGDQYLLCDKQHSIGNQEGLIFSSFLGLHLVEPLNWLGVAASKQDKLSKNTAAEREQLEATLARLQEQSGAVKSQLSKLSLDLRERRERFKGERYQEKLAAIQLSIRGRLSREQECGRAITDMTEALSFTRARETQIRELIALRLHFTGLDVRLCPNCDAEVSQVEIRREKETHHCRLCNKPAHDASHDEITAYQAEAEDLAEQVRQGERSRDALKRDAAQLSQEVSELQQQAEKIEAAAKSAVADAVPSQVEQDLHDRLLEEFGGLNAEITATKRRLEHYRESGAFDENRRRILLKAREVLREEAARRNAELLQRLNDLTKEVARQIGAESITDVKCSELGRVQLTKHDEIVQFTGIKNQGERMRVKLAFFLAMMRLGREQGLGRHPGLLLVDQPGSAEMVTEDFRALATVLHQLDETLEEQFQVLCFTARSEFSEATRPQKVYGPQAGKFAF
jgi:hypothetical protein